MTSELLDLVPSHRGPLPVPGAPSTYAEYPGFRAVRTSVLERDGDTCRYCGFTGQGPYMQIHHVDGDHENNDLENLNTACMHCHAVHHIGTWGGEASLVWLPELSQAEVSHFSRAYVMARCAGHDDQGFDQILAEPGEVLVYMATTGQIMESLHQRAAVAREKLGITSTRVLARALAELGPDDYARRGEMLSGYRLVFERSLVPLYGVGAQRDPSMEFAREWARMGYNFTDLPWDVLEKVGVRRPNQSMDT